MQCKIHTPATKLQIEFNQAAILGRRDWKFIRRPPPPPPPPQKKKKKIKDGKKLSVWAFARFRLD